MNFIKTNIQEHGVGMVGSIASWMGVITATQQQFEWWFRCMSYLAATGVSLVTLYYIIKSNRGHK